MTTTNSASLAILLTPPGVAAISVVRLGGPLAVPFIKSRFSKPIAMGRCVHGLLSDGSEVIDDPVVVQVRHDVVDINLHGGTWVVRAILALAAREGFCLENRSTGEMSVMAVDGQTPLEIELLQAMPLAQTDLALSRLVNQTAAWTALHKKWATKTDGEQVREELSLILADESLWHLLRQPRVAIVGAPNVGKSTLANLLFSQARSITADLPGTTRDWVGEGANIDGLSVVLIDTPGIRETEDALEVTAIRLAGAAIGGADLVILLLDPTQPLAEQQTLITRFPKALRVANKCDATSTWEEPIRGLLHTSAKTGAGIDELRRAIQNHFHVHARASWAARWWTLEQRAAIDAGRHDFQGFMSWVRKQTSDIAVNVEAANMSPT